MVSASEMKLNRAALSQNLLPLLDLSSQLDSPQMPEPTSRLPLYSLYPHFRHALPSLAH